MKDNFINSVRARKIKDSLKTDMRNKGLNDKTQSLVTFLKMNWDAEAVVEWLA